MKDFEIFNDLFESTLIRHRGRIKEFDVRGLANLFFLYVLALQIIKNEHKSESFAAEYMSETKQWGDYNSYRVSGTDLYTILFLLFGRENDNYASLLKNHSENESLSKTLQFDQQNFKRWAKNISEKHNDEDFDARYLLRLENDLHIKVSDYRSLRRLISSWKNLTKSEKSLVLTRIMFAFQNHAHQSELFPVLKTIAREGNLLIGSAKNPERDTNDFKENASCGAASAGAIASTPVSLFSQPISRMPRTVTKKKHKSRKIPDTDK